ncbi:MAG: hypothetical protein KC621_34950, partial [Myxococcales bacterium]|nr:hypothetical protein [Myxococcales bacterium]
PDAYRYLLAALLDHGELSLGQIRALLDRAGADQMALGGMIELAVSRGDAARMMDRLVVTQGAVARRAIAEATPSVLLSDPLYRAYLADAVEARDDRRAEIRRDAAAPRFRGWDRRLFGHPLVPDRIDKDLERVLLDRPLSAFPLAQPADGLPRVVDEPFLDAWEEEGLTIALPPSLAQLQGGLAAVNRILRQARTGHDVSIPDVSYRPMAVHSAILHPGEPLPRAVPDVRTLRQRVLMHAPYPAMVTAALLLHRQRPDRISVLEDRSGWVIKVQGSGPIGLLDAIDGFGASRGWVCSRRVAGGLPAPVLVAVLEVLGVATMVGRLLVLSEPLFARLGSDAEEMEIHQRMRGLADAFEGWLVAGAEG